jgi:hypothetical protein
MVLPPPRSQEADAGGLGRELLSACAEPNTAIKPTLKHPAANTAIDFLILLPPWKFVRYH